MISQALCISRCFTVLLVLGRILAISVVDLMKASCGPYERLGKKGT